MTVAEMLKSNEMMLTPSQVAPVIGMSPATLRWQARKAPHLLGFPTQVSGSRVRIPRITFLQWLGVMK